MDSRIDLEYDKTKAMILLGIELLFIVIMLVLLVYWHYKHPNSRDVTLGYEKELLDKQQREQAQNQIN